MTTTPSAVTDPASAENGGLWPMLHPSELRPAQRSPEEHHALESLLRASRRLEGTVANAKRRETFRMTRSLLAASRVVGFTVPELAAMVGVTAGSIRNRSSVLAPIPRSQFRTLLAEVAGPAVEGDALEANTGDGWDSEEDPVQLLTSYLSAAYVSPQEHTA